MWPNLSIWTKQILTKENVSILRSLNLESMTLLTRLNDKNSGFITASLHPKAGKVMFSHMAAPSQRGTLWFLVPDPFLESTSWSLVPSTFLGRVTPVRASWPLGYIHPTGEGYPPPERMCGAGRYASCVHLVYLMQLPQKYGSRRDFQLLLPDY